ncbi:MAG: Ig-like domain-containing protein, partial [Terracidiphilus sp.]
SSSLANNTTYWISVTTGVKSSGEDSLAAAYGSSTTSQFTTAAIAIVPTVSSQTPAVGATGVAITVQPTVVFSTAMDAATITTFQFFGQQHNLLDFSYDRGKILRRGFSGGCLRVINNQSVYDAKRRPNYNNYLPEFRFS